jgi:hypothetical protein
LLVVVVDCCWWWWLMVVVQKGFGKTCQTRHTGVGFGWVPQTPPIPVPAKPIPGYPRGSANPCYALVQRPLSHKPCKPTSLVPVLVLRSSSSRTGWIFPALVISKNYPLRNNLDLPVIRCHGNFVSAPIGPGCRLAPTGPGPTSANPCRHQTICPSPLSYLVSVLTTSPGPYVLYVYIYLFFIYQIFYHATFINNFIIVPFLMILILLTI